MAGVGDGSIGRDGVQWILLPTHQCHHHHFFGGAPTKAQSCCYPSSLVGLWSPGAPSLINSPAWPNPPSCKGLLGLGTQAFNAGMPPPSSADHHQVVKSHSRTLRTPWQAMDHQDFAYSVPSGCAPCRSISMGIITRGAHCEIRRWRRPVSTCFSETGVSCGRLPRLRRGIMGHLLVSFVYLNPCLCPYPQHEGGIDRFQGEAIWKRSTTHDLINGHTRTILTPSKSKVWIPLS